MNKAKFMLKRAMVNSADIPEHARIMGNTLLDLVEKQNAGKPDDDWDDVSTFATADVLAALPARWFELALAMMDEDEEDEQ